MERRYSSLVATYAFDIRAGLGIFGPFEDQTYTDPAPLTKNNNNGREEVWRSQLKFITVELL